MANSLLGVPQLGRVKWYNTKSGYGFITQLDTDRDIFIHHNYIRKENKTDYKYLVMGEYVQFVIVENTNSSSNDKHKYVADDVCGVKGGKLMCDTRKEYRDSKVAYKRVNGDDDLPELVDDEGDFVPVVSRRAAPAPTETAPVPPKRKYVRRTVL